MQLLINIDEDTYKDIKKGKIYTSVRDVPQESVVAIANGTPLPKNHGRLIDADAYTKEYCVCGYLEDIEIDYFNTITPTIIEAESEED